MMHSISRMSCTVDGCDWFHDDTGPDPRIGWSVRGRTVDDCINQVSRLHYQAIEEVLAEHLATHEPVEYLRTIQRLSSQVAELEQLLTDAVMHYGLPHQVLSGAGREPLDRTHEEKLRAGQELAAQMAAELGPVTEAELEELRKVWPPD